MTKLTFALEPNGPKQLEVSSSVFWKTTQIQLNGNLLGTIPSRQELAAGQSFQLPDGSTLTIQLVQEELRVLRNEHPLPGSSSDPATRLAEARTVLYLIASLSIVSGWIAWMFQVEFLRTLGAGPVTILGGLVFGLLAYFTQRRSFIALVLAIGLFGVDTILVVFLSMSGGLNVALLFQLALRLIFFRALANGLAAIRVLKQEPPSVVASG